MSKPTNIRQEKKKGLTDDELVAKYEAGKVPVANLISRLLAKPNPNAPAKVSKKR